MNKGKGVDNTATNENLPWVEKYRPTSLDQLISHEKIIETINKFIEQNRLPHLLFYGPPGTGKTTAILAIARKLYKERYKSMILELNASDDRGIDVVRDQIKSFASTRTIFSSGMKLIILDEADAMTNPAQASLRRIIEKYTKNVRFCIICNYVSKIIPALQSRCTRFRFSPLKTEQIEKRLNYIIECENVNITEKGKTALMKLANGDMRKTLNILQSTVAAFDTITEESIYTCVGHPHKEDINTIIESMMSEDYSVSYKKIMSIIKEKGYALQDILSEVSKLSSQLDLPPEARIYLTESLAEIEYNISIGCTEQLQLGCLISTFKMTLELSLNSKK
ncbi:DNA replication factor [Piromyces finnis]|uniref:Replication factor C subunit 3 n=1 Tax=Piromyces finnis TaxID=1754191 RepID=A0A1Y1UY96_9FUNG|nr:DNA replication factor [Piromyces finnis]|eukprot:ORX43393.1 DNA replication factor [Piromyces finnis]